MAGSHNRGAKIGNHIVSEGTVHDGVPAEGRILNHHKNAKETNQIRREPGQGSQTALRLRNLALVREALEAHGGLTQVEIACHTGLSAATVSNLVSHLQHNEEVLCSPTTRSGRRATLVELILQGSHGNDLQE